MSFLETQTKKGNNEHKYSKQTNRTQNKTNPKIAMIVSRLISLQCPEWALILSLVNLPLTRCNIFPEPVRPLFYKKLPD